MGHHEHIWWATFQASALVGAWAWINKRFNEKYYGIFLSFLLVFVLVQLTVGVLSYFIQKYSFSYLVYNCSYWKRITIGKEKRLTNFKRVWPPRGKTTRIWKHWRFSRLNLRLRKRLCRSSKKKTKESKRNSKILANYYWTASWLTRNFKVIHHLKNNRTPYRSLYISFQHCICWLL